MGLVSGGQCGWQHANQKEQVLLGRASVFRSELCNSLAGDLMPLSLRFLIQKKKKKKEDTPFEIKQEDSYPLH